MTLSTNIYILDPIAYREIFTYCQTVLGLYDKERRGPDRQSWTHEQDPTWRAGERVIEPDNPWTIGNDPMQNLPAWLLLHYRPYAPLRTPEQAAEHDEWCESTCDSADHGRPACWIDVDFDTAYGYQQDGMGCGDLHAALVSHLGEWLDGRGIRWSWQNEYTGEVHGGPDRYARLIDLASAGFESAAWFQTTVLPAIAAKIADVD